MATTLPITLRGAEKLKEELHRLKHVERPAVVMAIAEARAQGDLSENAEYDAAKDRQGFIEGRIQEIEGKLSVAQIIDPSTLDSGGQVVFGATVELEEESSATAARAASATSGGTRCKRSAIDLFTPSSPRPTASRMYRIASGAFVARL